MIRFEGMEILETLDELVAPQHTALLLWDFDKRVISNAFNYASMVQNTAKLLQTAREHHVRALYSLQNNMRIMGDTGAPTMRMRMRRQGKGVADLAGRTPQPWPPPKPEIDEGVRPQEGDILFEKFIPNAFLGTCFEWWLRKYEIKTIVLTGVNVSTGIIGTASEAINRGFYAVIARDCVGTGSEVDYKTAVAYIERIFDIFDAAEIIAAWNRK